MPKLKTRKSILRRIKITSTGKLFHGSSFKRHLRRNKSASQKRRYKNVSMFPPAITKKIKKRLGI